MSAARGRSYRVGADDERFVNAVSAPIAVRGQFQTTADPPVLNYGFFQLAPWHEAWESSTWLEMSLWFTSFRIDTALFHFVPSAGFSTNGTIGICHFPDPSVAQPATAQDFAVAISQSGERGGELQCTREWVLVITGKSLFPNSINQQLPEGAAKPQVTPANTAGIAYFAPTVDCDKDPVGRVYCYVTGTFFGKRTKKAEPAKEVGASPQATALARQGIFIFEHGTAIGTAYLSMVPTSTDANFTSAVAGRTVTLDDGTGNEYYVNAPLAADLAGRTAFDCGTDVNAHIGTNPDVCYARATNSTRVDYVLFGLDPAHREWSSPRSVAGASRPHQSFIATAAAYDIRPTGIWTININGVATCVSINASSTPAADLQQILPVQTGDRVAYFYTPSGSPSRGTLPAPSVTSFESIGVPGPGAVIRRTAAGPKFVLAELAVNGRPISSSNGVPIDITQVRGQTFTTTNPLYASVVQDGQLAGPSNRLPVDVQGTVDISNNPEVRANLQVLGLPVDTINRVPTNNGLAAAFDSLHL